ncbi:MurR/RpiR family transcriptional regulator [Microbacterium sp.]|uniref:MurR/RpiR family transcriptional regulator n=1 Tax=Microbacterium sp. TaxID=51671 RepID=UPI003C7922A1
MVGRASVQSVSIQSVLQARLSTYPPTMKRVGELFLERPEMVVNSTTSELARICQTSGATIVRFCRALGFAGFPALKLQLAAELAKESAELAGTSIMRHGADISQSDSLDDMVSKISGSEILGIRETADSLDTRALGRAIQKILRSRRVLTFGVSASNVGAHDLATKLLRIGFTALNFQDSHEALASATLGEPKDVAIGFSHSGETRETVAFLAAARAAGAFTIAIVNLPESTLGTSADVTLRTAVRETTFRSGAMASRIAQLTLVDYLFVGVARGQYDRTVKALKSTYDIVKELRSGA